MTERPSDLAATAEAMAELCRERLAASEAAVDPLTVVNRARFEGALTALEALLRQPPSLLGQRAADFHLSSL